MAAWYPIALIGDGAACECGRFITTEQVTRRGDQARELDGAIPHRDRKAVYEGHQSGQFQFLSICGLCREGYNDPEVACVAVFRPVSKKCSSLAEQMKGRACRPLRSVARILQTLPDAESRVKAIAESAKPNALIVDLVGITGLADCASTIEIYAEGLPDQVKNRAEKILAAAGLGEEADVQEAIEQAKREDEEARDRIRKEREAAERKAKEEFQRRSQADAQARYTTHDVGFGSTDPNVPTEGQIKFIALLGMELLKVTLSKKQAGRMITMLKRRVPADQVAHAHRLTESQWRAKGPSPKQLGFMRFKGVRSDRAKTGYDACQLLDAKLEPQKYEAAKLSEIMKARSAEDLDPIGFDMGLVSGTLKADVWDRIVKAGKARRQQLIAPRPIADAPEHYPLEPGEDHEYRF